MVDRNYYNVYIPQTIITTFLDVDDNSIKRVVSEILALGDKQNRSSNVKADMSSWHIWNEIDVDPILKKIIDEVDRYTNKPIGNKNSETVLTDVWSAVYRKGDYTLKHRHDTSMFAFVYYLQAEEGDAPLIFDCLNNFSITPKKNMLVIFPGSIDHYVPTQECTKERIVLAGNVDVT